ncbi:MAG: hypothetical protein JO301_02615 [Chitinophagaceae bacterium]|nr:hypothetical protein [Chitinophagaceae bacterium]
MEKKKTKSEKAAAAAEKADKKAKPTSTQATGPKRQAVEMTRRKSGSAGDSGADFGVWQG